MDGRVHGRTYPRWNPTRWQLLPAAGVDLVFPAGLQTHRARQTADDVSQHGSFGRSRFSSCARCAMSFFSARNRGPVPPRPTYFLRVLKPDGLFDNAADPARGSQRIWVLQRKPAPQQSWMRSLLVNTNPVIAHLCF